MKTPSCAWISKSVCVKINFIFEFHFSIIFWRTRVSLLKKSRCRELPGRKEVGMGASSGSFRIPGPSSGHPIGHLTYARKWRLVTCSGSSNLGCSPLSVFLFLSFQETLPSCVPNCYISRKKKAYCSTPFIKSGILRALFTTVKSILLMWTGLFISANAVRPVRIRSMKIQYFLHSPNPLLLPIPLGEPTELCSALIILSLAECCAHRAGRFLCLPGTHTKHVYNVGHGFKHEH